jgi:hypothetical protein
MWYVMLMRNSNYVMSIIISFGFYLPLVKINALSHYEGVLCFVHITSHENVYI